MNIAFVHEGLGQFETLHRYLNSTGLAKSWFLVSRGVYNAKKDAVPNLVPFDMPPEKETSYFYTRGLEARTQRSFMIRQAILDLKKTVPVDVVVAHGSGGFPLQVFDSVGCPVITYIEFPSFTAHGYDEKYPQPEYATYRDKLFEMASYHQVVASELVIVPSAYAKRMFPSYLHDKIYVQMEGFDIRRGSTNFARKEGFFHIGYSARDLSSAKGFEQFLIIAKAIAKARDNVRFVFCGSPKTLYSYEGEFLQKSFQQDSRPASFMEYLLRREGIELGEGSRFEHVGFAEYPKYSEFIEAMDMFLYPLQYGSANWGLFELLFRGRVVVGSNRCFLPEVIRHGYNGLLCDYHDVENWLATVLPIIDNPSRYAHLGVNAERDAHRRFHISAVAPSYLEIFQAAISRYRLRSAQ